MDVKALEAKKTELSDKYNELQAQNNNISTEMRRLEGAFRMLEELINESGAQAEKDEEDAPPKRTKTL